MGLCRNAIASNGNLYASVKGILSKSTDDTTLDAISDLPSSDVYNVKIDVAPSNPNYV